MVFRWTFNLLIHLLVDQQALGMFFSTGFIGIPYHGKPLHECDSLYLGLQASVVGI